MNPLKLSNLTIDTPIFAAPLAGITDWPYRQILRKCAPNAPIMTEMISCHSLIQNQKNKQTNNARNFDNYKNENLIIAQIFGADPKIMADGAKILEQHGASMIDINMGCPVPKVATRAGAGAFLMCDHKLAGQIVNAVSRAVKIPVSIKTRLGWDEQHLDSSMLVRIAAENGAQMSTIHGRTRSQGYTGKANWDKIKDIDIQSGVKNPIIFNGDIKTSEDIAAVEKLGADGVMIGRALLGNPWLLGELADSRAKSEDIKFKQNDSNSALCALRSYNLILEHLDLTVSYYGARAAVPLFRKHAAWYAGGRSGATNFRVRINQINDAETMRKAIQEFFIEN